MALFSMGDGLYAGKAGTVEILSPPFLLAGSGWRLEEKKPAEGALPAGKGQTCLADLRDVGSLGPFRTLYDFEFNGITLLKSAIAIADDRRVMNENVSAVLASNEAETLGIVEPLDLALHVREPPTPR